MVAGNEHLRDVPTSDIVGEIAALEWHAGFTYPRTASVVATSRVRLLVIPGGIVHDLARNVPLVGERLRPPPRSTCPPSDGGTGDSRPHGPGDILAP